MVVNAGLAEKFDQRFSLWVGHEPAQFWNAEIVSE
jgi:hypothetical protein